MLRAMRLYVQSRSDINADLVAEWDRVKEIIISVKCFYGHLVPTTQIP